MKFLIVNADDFGYSARVNAAVRKAHVEGILTSASLMVAEDGREEAVENARRLPGLGVGLHVVTSYDKALLPREAIPHLVGPDGKFGKDPVKIAVRYACSPAAQAELQKEMTAQFECFARTGLPWSHADGHQHFHMHPAVWNIFLGLCDQFGVHRIRLPYEPIRAHLRQGGDGPNINTAALLFLRVLRRRCLRMLRERRTLGGNPVFSCDRVYGTLQTGNMTAAYTAALLDRLEGRVNEVYFHPGTDHALPLPAARQTESVRDVDMEALLAPAVRARIEALGLCVGRYEDAEAAVKASGGN